MIFSLVVLLLFSSLVQSVDKNKFKKCDQESWCRRQRGLRSDQVHYEIESDLGTKFGTVELRNGSIFAKVHEKFSRIHFNVQIDLQEDEVVRLRIDELYPLNGKRRYSPKDVLLDSLKKVDIKTIREVGEYIVFDVSPVKQFRFNNRLQFELLENDQLVVSANSRGLLYMEHFRENNNNNNNNNDNTNNNDGTVDVLNPDNYELSNNNINLIDFTNAWSDTFGGDTDNSNHGPQSVGMDFTFQSENVYGIPMHATDLSLKTTTGDNAQYSEPYRMYNLDVFEYEIDEPMALYGHVPMMIGHSEKYTSGIYWHNSAETWIDVQRNLDSPKETHTHWFSESGQLDVFFLSGPRPKDIFRQFSSLVGTQALPPTFAISYHQCRWNYIDEEDVRNVNAKFEEHNFPMDVMWLDIEHTNEKRYFTWDPTNFPNPTKMIDEMSSFGRKMVTIVDPHMKRDGGWKTHQEASSNQFYVKHGDNNGEYEGICWSGSSSWIDYTNPDARNWWKNHFSFNNYKGSTTDLYVWNDMNEPSVFSGPETTMKKNAIHHEGWEHRDVHNVYGMFMQRATAEGLVARNTWCNGNLRSFVLSRAFFAGSQRWGAIWTGDNKADWTHLQAAQPMLLSSGLGGITFIGADVGGFFGNPSAELLIRWYQAATYQPFFRAHAHIDSKRREPWLFGEFPLAQMRNSVVTRYALLPYLYTLFHQASIDGTPVMRPIFVEYPNDINSFKVQDTFLLGSDLLVTPVTKESANSVEVYLPRGSWYDIYTHEKVFGGKSMTVDAPLHKIPVYQRGGSIIPRKLRVRRSSSLMETDPITLHIALDGKHKASGDIYIDDGKSFDFKSGKYAYRRINYEQVNENNHEINSIRAAYNDLNSTQENTNGGNFEAENRIERIVLMGIEKKPASITLFTSSNDKVGTSLEFDGDSTTINTIIIKRPGCHIVNDWRVSIQF